MLCSAAGLQCYFGVFAHSIRQLMDYPFGGFSEEITGWPGSCRRAARMAAAIGLLRHKPVRRLSVFSAECADAVSSYLSLLSRPGVFTYRGLED